MSSDVFLFNLTFRAPVQKLIWLPSLETLSKKCATVLMLLLGLRSETEELNKNTLDDMASNKMFHPDERIPSCI